MKRTRRNHGDTFKAHVTLASRKGDKTITKLTEQFRIHPTQITERKQQLLARAADVFGRPHHRRTPDLKTLHANWPTDPGALISENGRSSRRAY